MMMKELILKVTIFYGQTIQVTKKEETFVCIIRNNFLLLKEMIYVPLKECLITEIRVHKKMFFFSCLYKSPSQTQNEFEEFCNDLNLLLSNVNDVNTTLSVITGDFNAKSSGWWSLD